MAPDAETHWAEVVRPWLEYWSQAAWQGHGVVAVLVPASGLSGYLHERALAEKFSWAGLRFWTPDQARLYACRHWLEQECSPAPPHALEIALATAACARDSNLASSIGLEPASLLRAVEQVENSGWDFAEEGPASFRELVRLWKTILDAHAWRTAAEIDRLLTEKASTFPLRALLVTGFSGAHWHHWKFLRAFGTAAGELTVTLTAPRNEAEELDQAWIGTWEDAFGEATPVGSADPREDEKRRLFARFACVLGSAGRDGRKAQRLLEIRVGAHVQEEARAIVSQVADWLSTGVCQRVGIVVPGSGTLAREVSALLSLHDLPHEDSFGSARPGPLEHPEWLGWLDFQEAPSLDHLLDFLALAGPETRLHLGQGDVGAAQQLAEGLQREFSNILIDDLRLLGATLPDTSVAKRTFERLPMLPPLATWMEFQESLHLALDALGWAEIRDRLTALVGRHELESPYLLTRAIFLRWLRRLARSTDRQRAETGSHRYARIQLTTFAEAENETWTHLVLTSMSEGVWPPHPEDSPFLSHAETVRLNASLGRLRRASLVEGKHGEGHLIAAPGKAVCLGPSEQLHLINRQWCALMENVTGGVAITLRLRDGEGPPLRPSEFASRLYWEDRGETFSDSMVAAELAATRSYAAGILGPPRAPDASAPGDDVMALGLGRTLEAWSARRDTRQPFSAYSFALSRPPAEPLKLSCKEWEEALASPAIVWMRRVLGIRPRDPLRLDSLSARALGTLAHRWLAGAPEATGASFAPLPPLEDWLKSIESSAAQHRGWMEHLARRAGRALPLWWISMWREAREISLRLARSTHAMAHKRNWHTLAAEVSIPEIAWGHPDGPGVLWLRGKVDALFAKPEASGPKPLSTIEQALVIDYKTGGSAVDLSVENLTSGSGLQLALYLLALAAHGVPTAAALVIQATPRGKDATFSTSEIANLTDFWAALIRMQDTGVFGAHGDPRPDYGRGWTCPLAMLPVAPDILAAQWALTHPGLEEVPA